MSNHIVLLSGSPRKNGNTDKLAAAFVAGAASAGKHVALFRVADMKIGGCLGCRRCHQHGGECVQKDDMGGITEALRKADAMVLASPVYFFGVTAQLKLAIDRTFALLRENTARAKGALLLTCGNTDTGVADGSIAMFKRMCTYSGWENAGIILAAGVGIEGGLTGRPELAQAEALGRDI